jgi:hypothetical protein
MKICFSGTHRTGKTSLAERIAVDNNLIMFYTEVEKTFKKRSVKEAEQLTGKYGFYERLLQQENICNHVMGQIMRSENYSVFDRSAFDVYGYSEFFLSKLLGEFNAEREDFRAFEIHLGLIKQYFHSFDFTFIIQPGIEFEDDVGSCSMEIQESLNEVFLNAADLHLPKDKYFVMPKEVTDFEERVSICQGILAEKLDLAMTV